MPLVGMGLVGEEGVRGGVWGVWDGLFLESDNMKTNMEDKNNLGFLSEEISTQSRMSFTEIPFDSICRFSTTTRGSRDIQNML